MKFDQAEEWLEYLPNANATTEWPPVSTIRVTCDDLDSCDDLMIEKSNEKPDMEGIYTKMEIHTCYNRPVYKQVWPNELHFLYFNGDPNFWYSGPTICGDYAGLALLDSPLSPERGVISWVEYDGNEWKNNPNISVTCTTRAVCGSISLSGTYSIHSDLRGTYDLLPSIKCDYKPVYQLRSTETDNYIYFDNSGGLPWWLIGPVACGTQASMLLKEAVIAPYRATVSWHAYSQSDDAFILNPRIRLTCVGWLYNASSTTSTTTVTPPSTSSTTPTTTLFPDIVSTTTDLYLPDPVEEEKDDGLSIGVIVAIALGGVLLLVLVGVAIYCCVRVSRKSRSPPPSAAAVPGPGEAMVMATVAQPKLIYPPLHVLSGQEQGVTPTHVTPLPASNVNAQRYSEAPPPYNSNYEHLHVQTNPNRHRPLPSLQLPQQMEETPSEEDYMDPLPEPSAPPQKDIYLNITD